MLSLLTNTIDNFVGVYLALKARSKERLTCKDAKHALRQALYTILWTLQIESNFTTKIISQPKSHKIIIVLSDSEPICGQVQSVAQALSTKKKNVAQAQVNKHLQLWHLF